MKPATRKKVEFRIVLITAPDMKVARRLARTAVEERLAACCQLIPGVESHYRWQGRVTKSAEVLLIFKTTGGRVASLEKLVHREHPYDTPEFVSLDIASGSARYLKWLGDCCEQGT
jgi:periplasmic divalent cation tolerance protein